MKPGFSRQSHIYDQNIEFLLLTRGQNSRKILTRKAAAPDLFLKLALKVLPSSFKLNTPINSTKSNFWLYLLKINANARVKVPIIIRVDPLHACKI